MGWLIAGLFSMIALGALAVLARRWQPHRLPADRTLLAELLGPPGEPPPSPPPPSPPPPSPPGRPAAPPLREHAQPLRPPDWSPNGSPRGPLSGPPDERGDWLADQLAWINSWSQRMHEELTSPDGWPGPPAAEPGQPGPAGESEPG